MTTVYVAGPDELDVPTLYALLRLRVDVFVVEQRCPYQEIDGRDLAEAASDGECGVAVLHHRPDEWRRRGPESRPQEVAVLVQGQRTVEVVVTPVLVGQEAAAALG